MRKKENREKIQNLNVRKENKKVLKNTQSKKDSENKTQESIQDNAWIGIKNNYIANSILANSILNDAILFANNEIQNLISAKNKTNIEKITWISKNFPEIEYLIELYNNIFTIDDSIEYKILAQKAKILSKNIILNAVDDTAISDNFDLETIAKNKYDINEQRFILKIKSEIARFLKDSFFEIKKIIKDIIRCGHCYIYFNNNFTEWTHISPLNITITHIENYNKNENTDKKEDIMQILRKAILVEKNKINENQYIFSTTKFSEVEFYYNGKKLNKEQLYIIVPGKDLFEESYYLKIFDYARMLKFLETINILERINKTKILNVINVDISEIDEDTLNKLLLTYSEIFRGKFIQNAGIITNAETKQSNFEQANFTISDVVILPTFGKTEITKLANEYKPIYQDIKYIWDKILKTFGLQIFLNIEEFKSVPKELTNLYNYNTIATINKYKKIAVIILEFVLKTFTTIHYDINKIKVRIKSKLLQIMYPQYTTVDISKADKILQALTTITTVYGLQIKPEFVLKMLFPEYYPEEILVMQENKEEENAQNKLIEEYIPFISDTDLEDYNFLNAIIKNAFNEKDSDFIIIHGNISFN